MTIEYKDSKRIVDTSTFADSYWQLHTSKLVNMGSSLGNEGTGAWTQAVWHKADDTNSVTVYEKYNSSPDNGFFLAGTQGSAGYYWVDYGVLQINSGVSPTVGGWDHIVVTRSSGGAFTIYVNGVSRATGTSTSDIDLSSDFRFATHASGQSNIADFSLWQRELTASEVLTLYNTAKIDSISQTNLTHHYDFAQTGSTLTDQVGSINGTRTGATGVLTRNVDNIKPTNVQNNSIFVETDTARRYWSSLGTQSDTITKDGSSQSINTATSGTTLVKSITIGNNSNRILIVSTGEYSAGVVSGVTLGSQNFVRAISASHSTHGFITEIWYLINPTVGTADITVTWSGTAGRRGITGTSFYNVDQSQLLQNNVKNTVDSGGQSSTVSGTITPTTVGSMVIDAMMWLNGTQASLTRTAGAIQFINNNDRSTGQQYMLTPTIGSANAMNYTASDSARWIWVGVEVKSTTSPSTTWTREIPSFTASFWAAGGTASPWTPVNYHDQFSGSTWSSASPLGTAVEMVVGCGTQSAGLIMGGDTSGTVNPTTTVQEWNGSAWSTSTGGTLNVARGANAGGGINTDAWVACGNDGSTESTTSSFWDDSSWTSGAALSTARRNLAGGGSTTDCWVAGGYTGSASIASTEQYNGTAWSAGGNISAAQDGLAGGSGDTYNAIFTGGYDGSNNSNRSNIYNGTAWSLGGTLSNTHRYNITSGTPQDTIAGLGYVSSWTPTWAELYNGTTWSTTGSVGSGRTTGAGGN